MPIALIIYLVAIGHIWSRGSLFVWPRTHGPRLWVMLADCPLCSGFWIGVLGMYAYQYAPGLITMLGVGSLVGTASLAVYGLIRRI